MNELLIRQAEHAAKRRKALTALAWTAAILALLLVIGAIVCLVMLGLGNQNFYLLGFLALGGMLGAAALGHLSKKPQKGEPPALIETQGKERLKACISSHGHSLVGETPAPAAEGEKGAKPQKPQKEQRFVLPDAEKRRRQFPFLLLGAGLLVGGIVVAVLANRTIGIVLSCFGVYLLIHGAVGYCRARTELILFREGIWDKKATRAESSYLTWEEIESASFFEGREGTDKTPEEKPALILTCAYGDHGFTPVKEAYDYLLAHHPEKCRK